MEVRHYAGEAVVHTDEATYECRSVLRSLAELVAPKVSEQARAPLDLDRWSGTLPTRYAIARDLRGVRWALAVLRDCRHD
ncbi:hypothetical protein GCM10010193_26520 [Kitasatospora atroaurantiaca]|uniref:Uncharacterized protein n=1 Tax=Kitasatospora atroaurantiaca TaxID=285545 RepID=A0A561F0A6_9ACTN|nr:hypothetical protein FB465_6466 [Kitasatospora atroaurantiaca]